LIGAQAAMPGRQVVTLSGDGGIAMLLGDLLTLRQLNLPVKVVVFNDGSLGFVELEMKAVGWLSYGTDLVNPDFAKLAESANIKGIRVEAPEDLRPALQAALDHDGPCLVDIKVNRQELAMPPHNHGGAGFGIQSVHDASGSQRERRGSYGLGRNQLTSALNMRAGDPVLPGNYIFGSCLQRQLD
jgi:thiamine pyrophosphate-dependent acetolactate synthase large subunit-like protein